ncbi:multidrug resistance efflux transporter family protein [Luteibacter aegosomatissinici]|uniref:multidrug resistance efflux transporter family protein n=1 Tax=Luteibacter aegosomatissinici TaxID=2911539 RepID=UPI001FF9D8CE|nr:multidrug resistance efflux transporter family protein [Luteibacter aegosomatissinici]UPG95999.1 multidrug resistance efflux transporter family protein [Luteibacter aegosomatissinici]
MRSTALKAVAIALLSALFFTFTYVLNRAVVSGGGHWQWAVILRYLFTLPMLAAVLPFKGGLGKLPIELRSHPRTWLIWSTVGFVLFGVPLTWAATSGPSWLVAGSFQMTVLAGPLMAPFIYGDERARWHIGSLAIGALIVGGVMLLQFGHAHGGLDASAWLAVGAVAFAAFAYPLGNRKILLHLERTGTKLGPVQRVFGMTLASWPLWLVLAAVTLATIGPPTPREALLAAGTALSSGAIATILFFHATELVGRQPTALAAVEAMQAAELLLATVIGVLFLHESFPDAVSGLGAVGIIVGIALFAWVSGREGVAKDPGDRGA